VLEARKMTKRDLDEAIVGDLRHIELPEKHYDVIYSSFVLEHIRGAEQVLLNFIKWLAPGGIMIVRIPDRNSVLGFLTRIAPFWFHVFYYRHIKGDKEAGRPGRGPFPTFYDRIVSSNGIRAFCRQQGLIIAEEYMWRFHTRRRGRLISFEKLLFKLISLMSFRRLHCEYHNMTYIIEKPT
jgi:SAM-dependent methyltransferase